MTDVNFGDLEKLRWLINLKKNKPEEYKQFFDDVEGVIRDMIALSQKIGESLQ